MNSGILFFAGIKSFDLFGDGTELIALGFAQVSGVGFSEKQEEVDDVMLGKMQVDDPCAAAFSPPAECHADLAQSVATDQQVAEFRLSKEFPLESPVVLILHAFCELAGEMRSFDKRRASQETRYNVCR